MTIGETQVGHRDVSNRTDDLYDLQPTTGVPNVQKLAEGAIFVIETFNFQQVVFCFKTVAISKTKFGPSEI